MTAEDQSPRAGDGKPDNGWIHPGLGHPARPFAEWLNSQRMKDVSQVFHEIMARYCAALAAAPAAAPAELPPGVVVSSYRIDDGFSFIKVESVQHIDGPDLWAVRRNDYVLNRNGEWEWEPMPSGRFATPAEAFSALARFQAPATAPGAPT